VLGLPDTVAVQLSATLRVEEAVPDENALLDKMTVVEGLCDGVTDDEGETLLDAVPVTVTRGLAEIDDVADVDALVAILAEEDSVLLIELLTDILPVEEREMIGERLGVKDGSVEAEVLGLFDWGRLHDPDWELDEKAVDDADLAGEAESEIVAKTDRVRLVDPDRVGDALVEWVSKILEEVDGDSGGVRLIVTEPEEDCDLRGEDETLGLADTDAVTKPAVLLMTPLIVGFLLNDALLVAVGNALCES
jgi:hypothetical protein